MLSYHLQCIFGAAYRDLEDMCTISFGVLVTDQPVEQDGCLRIMEGFELWTIAWRERFGVLRFHPCTWLLFHVHQMKCEFAEEVPIRER